MPIDAAYFGAFSSSSNTEEFKVNLLELKDNTLVNFQEMTLENCVLVKQLGSDD